MNNSFDKNIKSKLDKASPEDAGVAFDPEKIWSHIQDKQKKKVSIRPSWWTHAAAIAAGLCLGFFLFRDTPPVPVLLSRGADTTMPDPASTKPGITHPDTGSTIARQETKARKTIPPVALPQSPENNATEKQTAEPASIEGGISNDPITFSPEPTVAAKPRKILYLSDIENSQKPEKMTPPVQQQIWTRIMEPIETSAHNEEKPFAMLANYLKKSNLK